MVACKRNTKAGCERGCASKHTLLREKGYQHPPPALLLGAEHRRVKHFFSFVSWQKSCAAMHNTGALKANMHAAEVLENPCSHCFLTVVFTITEIHSHCCCSAPDHTQYKDVI